MAVFRFVSSISDRLQKHMFYHIIEDAYAQSFFMAPQVAMKDLVKAISAHICYKTNEERLLRELFANNTTEIVTALNNGEHEGVTDGIKLELPDKRIMYDAFSYFKWGGDGEPDLSHMNEHIEMLITQFVEENKQKSEEENAFEKLGFLTLIINVNRRLSKEVLAVKYRSIFFKWYCDGQILDVVFDTMMKSKITSVKRELLNRITEGCLKDRILCEVVNTKWNEYRTFNDMISERTRFKTEDTHSDDTDYAVERVEPLGQPDKDIFAKMKGINNDGFKLIYSYLVENNYLNKEETKDFEFIDIFTDSKDNKRIKRVVFHLEFEYNVNNLFYFFWYWYYKDYCKNNKLTKKEFFVKFKNCLKLMVMRNSQEDETMGDDTHLNLVRGIRGLYDDLDDLRKKL